MEPVLDIRNLNVALPSAADRLHAINDFSLQANAGEIVCVVGESGSGKSVAANAVLGLLPSSLPILGGSISFMGTNLLEESREAMRNRRGRDIGMIFQEPMSALSPIMKVGQQSTEVLLSHGQTDRRANRRLVLEWLRRVGLSDCERVYGSFPFRLSGGQRQRVMIAMALIMKPKLLIADESTTALDVTTQKQILTQIDDLRKQNSLSVLFITHDFGVVSDIADKVIVMEKGIVVEQGTRDEVLLKPQHPYTKRLIAAVPRPPSGQHVEPESVAEVALQIRKLSKSYQLRSGLFSSSNFAALKEVSLSLRRNETLGIVGESGSGKSTLARCIVRREMPDGGEILFAGRNLARVSQSEYRPFRPRIQMIFQDPFASLNPRRSIGDIICQGPLANGVSKNVAKARARDLLELVGLNAGSFDRYPHEFSGGQRQRVGIARALALEPEILIADEPVSALDVSIQAQILELLQDLRKRFGLSMIFITHDLLIAAEICDRIAVMQHGCVVEEGSAVDIFGSPTHQYTQNLINAVPGRDWLFSQVSGGGNNFAGVSRS